MFYVTSDLPTSWESLLAYSPEFFLTQHPRSGPRGFGGLPPKNSALKWYYYTRNLLIFWALNGLLFIVLLSDTGDNVVDTQ
jgi:hypothetical protein